MRNRTAPAEHDVAPFAQRRIVVLTATLLAMAVAAGGAWLAWRAVPELPVREVTFTGQLTRVNGDELKRIAHGIRGNLFGIDLEQIRAAFQQAEWVRNVEVRRRLPGTLEVVIEEHQPVAVWGERDADEPQLVDEQGAVFHAALDDDAANALPLLAGPVEQSRDLLAHFRQFQLALKPVSRAPRELNLSARGAWRLTLDNGAVLELGRDDTDPRLQRFLAAYAQVPDLQAANAHIDLRYRTGLAVKRSRDAGNTNTNAATSGKRT